MHTSLQKTPKQPDSLVARAVRKTIIIFSSRYFFWAIIALFIVQCLWIALSFRYPMLFDERYHVGVINIFSHEYLPFISHQPATGAYDMFGNLSYGNASLYHYLMSFPNRILTSLSGSLAVQVIGMRVINILMAAAGLYVFSRLFTALGVRQILINLGILFYTLIPLVVFVSATVSYDNMLFPLTALFLLFGVRIIKSKKADARDYSLFLAIGLLTTLVKFTFLPILLAGIVFVLVRDGVRHKQKLLVQLKKTSTSLSRTNKVLLVVIIIAVLGLFVARYGVAVIRYGSPIPDCAKILTQQRCLASGVYAAEVSARSTKDQRLPEPIEIYAQNWVETILLQLDTSAATTQSGRLEVGKALPIISLLMVSAVVIGIGAVLYRLREFLRDQRWVFLLTMSLALVGVTFLFNITTYYSVHMDLNVQTRYLLSVLPIFIVMSLIALNDILGKRSIIKVVLVIGVLVLSTQGGGVIKHIMTSEDDWYWNNATLRQTNNALRGILTPIVKQERLVD